MGDKNQTHSDCGVSKVFRQEKKDTCKRFNQREVKKAMRVLHTEMRTRLKKPSKKCEALKNSTTVGSHSRPLAGKIQGRDFYYQSPMRAGVLKERSTLAMEKCGSYKDLSKATFLSFDSAKPKRKSQRVCELASAGYRSQASRIPSKTENRSDIGSWGQQKNNSQHSRLRQVIYMTGDYNLEICIFSVEFIYSAVWECNRK